MAEILVNSGEGKDWQKHSDERVSDGANPNLSWRFLIDASKQKSEGLSMGCLRLPVGETLPLHNHKEQEIYYILQGKGEILISNTATRPVVEGDSVYIPTGSPHGIKNTGDNDLMFLWVFPTDSWHEVGYNYMGY
ncbi:MAG: cupin [Aestuariivita sp.]|nr:cupin [Aestuariivita sp.]|tara:strand:+ start:57 stop:461 length:405 start_codon:yes stop_codon:yes gene_type:complete